jgi:hypothetical protein
MNKYNGEETKYKRFAASSKGYSQREISQILLIGVSYSKEISYLRNQAKAKTNIRKYIDEGRYRIRKVLRSRKENL